MYVRLSVLDFDPDQQAAVEEYFAAEGSAGPAGQPGWAGSAVLAEEAPGRLRTLTYWNQESDFVDFHTGRHQPVNQAFAELGVRVSERSAARTIVPPVLQGRFVKLVTIDASPEKFEAITQYWRETGRVLVLAQPGAVRAEAYRSGEQEITIWFEWDSPAAAEQFRNTPAHEEFGRGMGTPAELVRRRQEWERIEP